MKRFLILFSVFLNIGFVFFLLISTWVRRPESGPMVLPGEPPGHLFTAG